jgi:hypothetical protein
MEAFIPEDGHDARDDLALDASSAAVLDPLIKQVIVVEELCDDEVCPSVHLLLKVPDIILAGLCLKMYFGVAGDTNAEEVTIPLSDELHQVTSIVKPVLNGNPVSGTTRWVTSQRKEILDPKLLCLVERLEDFISSHIGACNVHEDI